MIIEMYQYDFVDGMADDFSYHAKNALWDYYSDLEDDLGEQIKFDRVAIRCEWSEYEDKEQVWNDYHHLFDMDEDEFYRLEWQEIAELLYEHTTVLVFKGGILIQQF